MDRRLLGDDAALLGRRLALMPAYHIDAAHQGATLARHHLIDLALLALVAAGEHDHLVALFDLSGRHRYSTSGAKLTIFMWFLALSSRVTGPKMRVPTGSPCGLISTARSEEHTSELQSLRHLVCRLLLEKNKITGPGYIVAAPDIRSSNVVSSTVAGATPSVTPMFAMARDACFSKELTELLSRA